MKRLKKGIVEKYLDENLPKNLRLIDKNDLEKY
jgi:hypothetical protein